MGGDSGGFVVQVFTAAAVIALVATSHPYLAIGVFLAGQAASYAMAPSPKKPKMPMFDSEFSEGILLNKAANDAPIPVVYGTRRVGGPRVFIETSGSSNKYLHIVVVLSEGPIHAINTVYLDGVPTSDSRFSKDGGLVRVKKHLGEDDQTADSDLVSEIPNWTSNHRLRGVAYLYVRLKFNRDAFTHIPTITADIQGRKVYDPRDGQTKFSNNPVLCVRDYLTNTRYGRGLSESDFDDTVGNASANYCDESVTVCGVSQKRYTCDGVVNTDRPGIDNTVSLLSSCRGVLVFSAGKYQLKIDKPETAAFTFDKDNIVGAWSIGLGNKRNRYNRVKGKFFNPDRDWQPDFVIQESNSYREDDNNLLLEKEIELPFTADYGTAKQISAIDLNQSRQQIVVKFTATVEALQKEIFDVVKITHTTPGWMEKEFRITSMRLKNNDEIEITAAEYDESVYDFGTIEAPDTVPDTTLPDPFSVEPPTDVEVSEELTTTREGRGVMNRVTVSWTESEDAFVEEYQVEYKESSWSAYIVAGRTTGNSFELDDFSAGNYIFRVSSLNTFGVSSEYASLTKEIFGLTQAPADLSEFSLQIVNNQAHLSWKQVSELDVKIGGKIRIRHTPATSSQSWFTGVNIGPAVPGSHTSVILPALTGTYMAKAVDSTGNESPNAVFAVTTVPDIVKMNVVETSDQDPTFSGTKTNMCVEGSVLKLSGGTNIDDVTDNIDDWLDFDTAGGVSSTGTYEFDNYIDLGAVFTSRVVASIAFSAVSLGDSIDNREDNIDDWEDFDTFNFSEVGADFYISTTDDDPSGSPTWSDWIKFYVGDYTCRAYKFKIEAYSGSVIHQIEISDLGVTVDMPDRVQGERNVSLDAGGSNISYDEAFHATPTVGITIVNMSTGDYLVLTNESSTGFTAQVKDSGGNGVARTINWQARGY